MKIPRSLSRATTAVVLAAGTFAPPQAAAQSTLAGMEPAGWKFAATLYGYLPTIGGKLNFPVSSTGGSINVDANTLIGELKGAFMGSFDAHNGRWGVFTDVLYMDVGGSEAKTRDFSIGRVGIPASASADLDLGLKGFVWTVAGEYRVMADPAWTVDVLAGARYLGIEPSLGWSINGDLGPIVLPGRSGSNEIKSNLWDGIVGVKGRYQFGDDRRWGVPFYADVGTGADGPDVAGGGGHQLFIQMGRRHRDVAISRLAGRIGPADRVAELQRTDAGGNPAMVSTRQSKPWSLPRCCLIQIVMAR